MYQAVVLGTWDEVNEYFEQGWEYVDSKIIEGLHNDLRFYFLLKSEP